MANVVRDPKEQPDAVLGEFVHPDPVRTFGLDDVAFVYGSRYKQRYFAKRGNDYYPLPARAMGHCSEALAPLSRGGWNGLVGSLDSLHRQRVKIFRINSLNRRSELNRFPSYWVAASFHSSLHLVKLDAH
jgi:hypothetical protein